MKQKKRSGFPRIMALPLVMLLAVNLVVPCFAATDTDYPVIYLDDTKTFETGVLNYDYDQIPSYMLDSTILRALEFIGYDVQFLKDQKLLFHPSYTGASLEAAQYLLREDPILTEIDYSTQGSPGGSVKTAETDWEKAWTLTGRVPNVPTHIENGMSCTSFVEYFYFAYLPNCEGKDVSKIVSMYEIAHNRVVNKTGTYPDTWTEMFEGQGGLISQGLADHYEIELDASQDQTEAYNKIWRQLNPGAVIRFGNASSPYIHYAIYAGTYNNLHYVIHVGNNRGPEIVIAESIGAETSSKQSWPIDFYDLKLEQKYGVIQVVKADADDDTKLAGAMFKATNRYTNKEYFIGPTNQYGYAIYEKFPLGTYDVVEVVPPTGYALDTTVHEVVLSDSEPFATLYREITNEKSFGALQIRKDTNTGNNKAGWQFNLYKLSPSYTTALTVDNSGQLFRVTVSDSSGNSVTSNAVSMQTTPLEILLQPSDVVAEAGTNVSFVVVAQGDGLTYQWQYKNPGEDWENSTASSANRPVYTLGMTTARDGRQARCIITDRYGNSITSDAGTIPGFERSVDYAIMFFENVFQFSAIFADLLEPNSNRHHPGQIPMPFMRMFLVPVNSSGLQQFRMLMEFTPYEFQRTVVRDICEIEQEYARQHGMQPRMYPTNDPDYPLSYKNCPVLFAYDLEIRRLRQALISYQLGKKFYVACYPEQVRFIRRIMPDVEFI